MSKYKTQSYLGLSKISSLTTPFLIKTAVVGPKLLIQLDGNTQ